MTAQVEVLRIGVVLLIIGLVIGLVAVSYNTLDLLASIIGLVSGLVVGALTGGRSA